MVGAVLQGGRDPCCRKKSFGLKKRSFTPKLLCLSATLLCCTTMFCAQARDFGVRGTISPIEEQDPIVLIQSKLKRMEGKGDLKRHQKALQEKTRAVVERPHPVEGVSKAQEFRVFYYDPTFVVREDITDHQGRVIHKKGTKINPLETVSLSEDLLFFDGDDPEQKEWAQRTLAKSLGTQEDKTPLVKLILVKGAPLALAEEWKVPVYFDQGGLLVKKLGIRHVPARVSQEDPSPQEGPGDAPGESHSRLRIEEGEPQ